MNKEFDYLCKKCPRLGLLLEEQQEYGLPQEKWLTVMRLLIDAGRISLARKFSEQSEKHNYESDEIIDTLSLCSTKNIHDSTVTGVVHLYSKGVLIIESAFFYGDSSATILNCDYCYDTKLFPVIFLGVHSHIVTEKPILSLSQNQKNIFIEYEA